MSAFDASELQKLAEIAKIIQKKKKEEEEEDGIDVSHIPTIKEMRRNKNIKKQQLLEYIDLYQQKVIKLIALKNKLLKQHRKKVSDLHNQLFKALGQHETKQSKNQVNTEQKNNDNNTHQYTAKQIENLMLFQTKLLQRIKDQKIIIQQFEAAKQIQIISKNNSKIKRNTSKLIASPLEFLYFIYAPSHCKPFENINKINIEKQLNLIKYCVNHKFNSNAIELTKPFLNAGMIELNNCERAASFHNILLQFISDKWLFECNKNNINQWDEFNISRCLYLPMDQFINLFGYGCYDKTVLCFIYDLMLWIIDIKYNFKAFEADFLQNKNNASVFAMNIIKAVYPNELNINQTWIKYLNNYWTPNKILNQIKRYNENNNGHWTLLFKQKLVKDNDKNDECFFENGVFTKNFGNPNAGLYSILDSINYDLYRDNNGKLVFLMLWPNITRINEKCQCQGMIWYQKSTPMNKKVRGYQQIMVPYPGNTKIEFCGISQSIRKCLLDGSTKGWYAIGATTDWRDKCIPGPIVFGNGVEVKHTEFYVFDIQCAINDYGKNILFLSGDWMMYNIALIVAEMIFDRTYIIKESLNKLYPLTLDLD
eukprot:351465_1